MTEITTNTETDIPLHPSDILMGLIVMLLAPMFLGVADGNISLARMAAIETVNAYRARNNADLIAIAQIIAFGLAALGSLSLSLADDISISIALRLRGNANACNRSAEQNRRVLAAARIHEPEPYRAAEPETPPAFDDHTVAGMFLTAAAAHELSQESEARLQESSIGVPSPSPVGTARTPEQKRSHEMWAIALIKESSELTASIPNLPPAQRDAAATRAATLSSTAHDLIHGASPPSLPTQQPQAQQTQA